jgi:hypothetical protein
VDTPLTRGKYTSESIRIRKRDSALESSVLRHADDGLMTARGHHAASDGRRMSFQPSQSGTK